MRGERALAPQTHGDEKRFGLVVFEGPLGFPASGLCVVCRKSNSGPSRVSVSGAPLKRHALPSSSGWQLAGAATIHGDSSLLSCYREATEESGSEESHQSFK